MQSTSFFISHKPFLFGSGLSRLGYLAWHQQRHAEAQQYAEAALACLEITEAERATSLSVLGLVAISWRKWEEGEAYIAEALQIRTAHGDQQRMAWNRQHLGYILHSQGDYAAAIPHYEAAIQILTTLQDLRNCGIAQMSLGIVYSLMQQPTQALAVYKLAESAFRKMQDYLFLAKILTNKGLDYLNLCEWQQAIQTFSDSAALYKKLDDLYGQLNALDGLGLAYCGLGLYKEASTLFETAIAQLPQGQADPSYDILGRELLSHLKEAQTKRGNDGKHNV